MKSYGNIDLVGCHGMALFGKKNPKWCPCVVWRANEDGKTIVVKWIDDGKMTKRLLVENFRKHDRSALDLIGRHGMALYGKKHPKWYPCVVKEDNMDGNTMKVQWNHDGKITRRVSIESFRKDDLSAFKWNIHEKKSPLLSRQTVMSENKMIHYPGLFDLKNVSNKPIDDGHNGKGWGYSSVVLDNFGRGWGYSSVVLDNYIYLIGGDGYNEYDDEKKSVLRINLSKPNTTWETNVVPDIDIKRIFPASVVYDGSIYLFGGDYEDEYYFDRLSSCLKYTPSSLLLNDTSKGKWRGISSLKVKRSHHAAVNARDKIYVMGGVGDFYNDEYEIVDTQQNVLKSMEIYDPSTNKFVYGPSLPIPLQQMSAVSIKNYIVVNGGLTVDKKINEKTFVFDINKNIWISIDSPSMNTPRWGHAATVLENDKIIVFGGWGKGRREAYGKLETIGLDTTEWISLKELLHGKLWMSIILLRCLVDRGRASSKTSSSSPSSSSPSSPSSSSKTSSSSSSSSSSSPAVEVTNFKRMSKKEEFCIQNLIEKSNNDIFHSILSFLKEKIQ